MFDQIARLMQQATTQHSYRWRKQREATERIFQVQSALKNSASQHSRVYDSHNILKCQRVRAQALLQANLNDVDDEKKAKL